MKYIEETGNSERLDIALKTIRTIGYTIAGVRGASAGATIGSVVPGAGSFVGGAVGAAAGVAQQYALDIVTDEGVHLASNALKSKYTSLTHREAGSLALAGMLTAGSTKVVKDYLQKSWSRVKVATHHNNFIHEQPSSHFNEPILNEQHSGTALKDKVVEKKFDQSNKPTKFKDKEFEQKGFLVDTHVEDISSSSTLLPNEGIVGTYKDLRKLGAPGDNLTPHHIPQNAFMEKYGIKKSEGVSIMVEQPVPGSGGRHRQTETFGRKPNLEATPRNELAKDVRDLKTIYQNDNVYTPEIRNGLQQVIQQNKEKFPDLFKKKE